MQNQLGDADNYTSLLLNVPSPFADTKYKTHPCYLISQVGCINIRNILCKSFSSQTKRRPSGDKRPLQSLRRLSQANCFIYDSSKCRTKNMNNAFLHYDTFCFRVYISWSGHKQSIYYKCNTWPSTRGLLLPAGLKAIVGNA